MLLGKMWQFRDESSPRCSSAFRACDWAGCPFPCLCFHCTVLSVVYLKHVRNPSHCFIQGKHFQRAGGTAVVKLDLVGFSTMILSGAGFHIHNTPQRFLSTNQKAKWIQEDDKSDFSRHSEVEFQCCAGCFASETNGNLSDWLPWINLWKLLSASCKGMKTDCIPLVARLYCCSYYAQFFIASPNNYK